MAPRQKGYDKRSSQDKSFPHDNILNHHLNGLVSPWVQQFYLIHLLGEAKKRIIKEFEKNQEFSCILAFTKAAVGIKLDLIN